MELGFSDSGSSPVGFDAGICFVSLARVEKARELAKMRPKMLVFFIVIEIKSRFWFKKSTYLFGKFGDPFIHF